MVQGTASIADALPRRPRRSSVPRTRDAWSSWRRRHIDRPARRSTLRAPSPSALAGTRRRASCRSGSRPAWIPERSATCLREADLNVLSKLGNQGLEWRLEPEAFTGGEVRREDDLLDILVGCPIDIQVAWQPST